MRDLPVRVVHVADPPRHAGREVAAGETEHHGGAARHVLTAVVADALDHGGDAGVADAEPLADDAADERLAPPGAVERAVAGDVVPPPPQRPLLPGGDVETPT